MDKEKLFASISLLINLKKAVNRRCTPMHDEKTRKLEMLLKYWFTHKDFETLLYTKKICFAFAFSAFIGVFGG